MATSEAAMPRCSVCSGLGCTMTDPVPFPGPPPAKPPTTPTTTTTTTTTATSAASSASLFKARPGSKSKSKSESESKSESRSPPPPPRPRPPPPSPSTCGHLVCRGCYNHIASVATLAALPTCAPQSVSSASLSTQKCVRKHTHTFRHCSRHLPREMGTTTAAAVTSGSNVDRKSVQVPARGPSAVVQCPVQGCGATSTRRDVSMLASDISTRDYLLQVMKDKEEEPEEGLCMLGRCMDKNSVAKKATLTCPRCKGMLFCESCFHIRHKAPGIKSHKGQPIPTSQVVTEEHMCPKHPKKDLDLFCLEEREPICALCAFSSAHSSHKCVPLDEIASQIRESLLSSTSKLEESVALESEAIKKCEASILESGQLLRSITSNVETETESILHAIQQNLSDVVSDCALLSSLIESHLKEHKECLEVCMSTHQRTITRAHEIAKSSDVVSLIAAEKKLKETLCECTQLVSSGAMTPCLSAKNVTHHVNTKALKEVLNNNFSSVLYTYNQPILGVKANVTGGFGLGLRSSKSKASSGSSSTSGSVKPVDPTVKPKIVLGSKSSSSSSSLPDVKKGCSSAHHSPHQCSSSHHSSRH
ncbi:tripartite motif-containing protein 39 [Pelomyxa schiedti]|nr:tripartite motif-containing protein 39 [Pelomyxa schiedti]